MPIQLTTPQARQPHGSSEADWEFCRSILPHVSRTFALGIRLLPPALRRSVTVSYLLCRIADSIEDDLNMPIEPRRALLGQIGAALTDEGLDLSPIEQAQCNPQVVRLTRAANCVLREFRRLPPADQAAIAPQVREMAAGMASYLRPLHPELKPVLEDLPDLRHYCYFVAGTVGQMLTQLFSVHNSRVDPGRQARLREVATGFGLGLQLTNIARDLTDDLSQQRNYVPSSLWRAAGLAPRDFLAHGSEAGSRLIIETLLHEARTSLGDGLEYCVLLPRSAIRIRVFCLTALFFACRTLALLERSPGQAGRRVKMPRREVYGILGLTLLIAPLNGALRAVFRALAPPIR